MNGKILDYNSEFKSGLIRGENGNKYRFSIDDCKSAIKPRPNAEVDFEPNGDKAIEVYVMTKDTVDDLKDIASSAVNATAYAARVGAYKSKKLIPFILGLVLIGVLVGLIVFIMDQSGKQKYTEQLEQERQKKIRLQNDIDHLIKVAEDSMKAKNYELAISKIDEAKKLDPNVFSSCSFDNMDPMCQNNNLWFYDSKLAIVYLTINKSSKALSLLGSPSSHLIGGGHLSPYHTASFLSKEDKALGCLITSKAYKMKGDLKAAEFYADWACKNGDCSLVEK